MTPRRSLGNSGEDLAARYLVSQGHDILARGWRAGRGEIDLVVCKDGEVVFVEVKTRRGRTYGLPEEALTWKKRQQLRALALLFFQRHPKFEGQPFRIDVVAIELGGEGGGRLRHLKAVV
jgi:putative endonuclease